MTTPSKSPPASELAGQLFLFQVKEIFALAVEQDEYLLRDLENLELENDAPSFLRKWRQANPDLSPETVARMWREPNPQPAGAGESSSGSAAGPGSLNSDLLNDINAGLDAVKRPADSRARRTQAHHQYGSTPIAHVPGPQTKPKAPTGQQPAAPAQAVPGRPSVPQVARRPHHILRLRARRSGGAPRRAAADVAGATAGEHAERRRDEGRCEGITASPLYRNRHHPVG